MGAVYFYQLSRSPLEEALARLLGRALAQGWRVAVRGTEREALDDLDAALWTQPADGFLPHGMAAGDRAAEQPVLLTLDAAPNAPDCLMAVHGAGVTPDEARALARCCILFDAAGTAQARRLWKAITAAGVAAQFWAEDEGGWQKKAEAGGAAPSA